MKALTLILALSATTPVFAQEKTIDLTNPPNYANQPVPAYITKDNTPADNAITDLGATLGRVLFYDKRLSRNATPFLPPARCSRPPHSKSKFLAVCEPGSTHSMDG